MNEHPVLFKGPMVRAILGDTKTQTRRVVKGTALEWLEKAGFTPEFVASPENNLCPYGKVGTRLWVRETWTPGDHFVGTGDCNPPEMVIYRADGTARTFTAGDGAFSELEPEGIDAQGHKWAVIPQDEVERWNLDSLKWKPSIFMYRWMSRINLEITGVRVELLNQITEEDAQAEGVEKDNVNPFEDTSYLGGFMNIWHQINGKKTPWESNCWVWVVSFKRID